MQTDFEICEKINKYAVTSLLYEVAATPKPGLVDRLNCGAHKDMDFFSFMSSTAAISSCFYKCALKGSEFKGEKPSDLLKGLRTIGIEAEKSMLEATGGVNAHKGLIFSLGLISAAAAYLIKENEGKYSGTEKLCDFISQMAKGICSRELKSIEKNGVLTHGESLYKKYGLTGVRGEAESGFNTVRIYSLPVFSKLKSENKYHINDILVQTLLHLMAHNDDTNIVSRNDLAALEYVKKYASKVLESGGMLDISGKEMILKMDSDFIMRNLSPGGSADLLAVTVMLDSLETSFNFKKP